MCIYINNNINNIVFFLKNNGHKNGFQNFKQMKKRTKIKKGDQVYCTISVQCIVTMSNDEDEQLFINFFLIWCSV